MWAWEDACLYFTGVSQRGTCVAFFPISGIMHAACNAGARATLIVIMGVRHVCTPTTGSFVFVQEEGYRHPALWCPGWGVPERRLCGSARR